MSAEGRANRRAFRGAGFREAASRTRIVARTSSQAGAPSRWAARPYSPRGNFSKPPRNPL